MNFDTAELDWKDPTILPSWPVGPEIPTITGGRRDQIIESIYARCTVEDRGYETPCYIWQGSDSGKPNEENKNARGHSYPKKSIDGFMARVHRVVMTHFEGYIPSKKHVDHRCNVRMCVRYEHLRLATHKQNMKFRDEHNGIVRKKRRRKRRKNEAAK